MRNVCIVLVSVVVFFTATPLFAAQTLNQETVRNSLTRYPFIKGLFKQERVLQGIGRPIRSSGRFMIWRDHGIYWETSRPLFQATTFSHNRVYYWSDENNPVIVEDGALRINERISQLMLAFFTADFDRLEQDFKAHWRFNGDSWAVELKPSGLYLKKAIHLVTIRGGQHIEEVALALATGDSTVITLDVTATGNAPDEESSKKIEPVDSPPAPKTD